VILLLSETTSPEALALLDRVPELTSYPDTHPSDQRAIYESDERLRAPAFLEEGE